MSEKTIGVFLSAERGVGLAADTWIVGADGRLTVSADRKVVGEFAPGAWIGVVDGECRTDGVADVSGDHAAKDADQ
jgi:hypothetical protein